MANGVDDPQRLSDPWIDFLILADRAEAVNGKLYMMGGAWDRMTVQDFRQPVLISFALGVIVPWNATNQEHQVQLTFEDTDRHQPVDFNLDVSFVAGRPAILGNGETQRVVLTVPAAPVTFSRPGSYQAVARIVNGAERRVEFHLLVANPSMQSPTPRQ